ncbi:MAG: TlpA disulfide reductase family protein [Gemmatimonadota bacterium]
MASARDEMRRRLLDRSLDRAPLRWRLRLRSPAGEPREVRLDEDDDDGGAITVVAFWSRYCPPSRAELGDLDGIADRLAQRGGVRFIGVTDEADGDDVAAFLEAEGHTFPTYLDPERDARNAFDNRATPSYVVLDRDGRIRFEGRSADDILRQVAALGTS